VLRENRLEQGARLTNCWLLGLRTTTFEFILASTSGQIFNAISIIHQASILDTQNLIQVPQINRVTPLVL